MMIKAKRIAFVDLQGFVMNNVFVLKEIAFSIESIGTDVCGISTQKYHYIYRPPFDWKFVSNRNKKQILWLTLFHHGFYWNDGFVPYSKMAQTVEPLQSSDLIVYVKGEEKISWLKNILNRDIDCRNIENIGCNLRLSNLPSVQQCSNHKHMATKCALRQVIFLEHWFDDNNNNNNG